MKWNRQQTANRFWIQSCMRTFFQTVHETVVCAPTGRRSNIENVNQPKFTCTRICHHSTFPSNKNLFRTMSSLWIAFVSDGRKICANVLETKRLLDLRTVTVLLLCIFGSASSVRWEKNLQNCSNFSMDAQPNKLTQIISDSFYVTEWKRECFRLIFYRLEDNIIAVVSWSDEMLLSFFSNDGRFLNLRFVFVLLLPAKYLTFQHRAIQFATHTSFTPLCIVRQSV